MLTVWILALWIPQLLIYGRELFTSSTPRIDSSLPLTLGLLGFGLLEVGISVWYTVVLLKCLGEVQGFSAWRALGNLFLAGMVMAVLIAIVALIISIL